jgi:pimeloyl-ACP methyl ester carboxylesterase
MHRRTLLQLATASAAAAALPRTKAAAATSNGKPAMPFIKAKDGTDLFVRDSGGNGAPVVFIHSWCISSQMWQYQWMPLVEAGYRCIAYDRRGHGRSDQPSTGYDIETLTGDLARVIEHSNARTATLVSHSMGACESVRYAAQRNTGRVTKLALLSPTTPCVLQKPGNPHGLPNAAFEQLRMVWRKDFGKWMDDNTEPFFTPETSPGMKRWLTGTMQSTPLDVAIACNKTMVETDFRPDCRDIKLPTLIVHGDKDASAPLPLTGAPTAALMPHATLKVYEGAPHGLFVTHMERLNADLLAFLKA